MVVAFAMMPIAARTMGPVRFGLLGIAWATLEYLGLFDLGLSRSTVRFVADAIARRTESLRQIVSVSISTQIVLALVAASLVYLAAPFLAGTVFKLPPEVEAEAAAMFKVVAMNVPVVIAMTAMRAVLEGAERFGLAAAIRIPGSAAAVVIPAVASLYGVPLPAMLLMVLGARLLVCLALAVALARAVPGFAWELPRDWSTLRRLAGYSGWVAVSGIVSPLLVSFDRFALGAVIGVGAVGFYTAPYEGMTRFLLLPIALFSTLFPALTAAEARGERSEVRRVLGSAARQMVILIIPVTLVVIVFGEEILRLWLGGQYAAGAAGAFRILAAGVLVNALAHLPSVFLYSAGRPDVPAKFHLLELLLHLPLTIWLIGRYGVTGAGLAWTIRVSIDALALYVASRRVIEAPVVPGVGPHGGRLALLVGGLAMGLLLVRVAGTGLMGTVALILLVCAGFAVGAWAWALTPAERRGWVRFVTRSNLETPVPPVAEIGG